MFITDYHSDYPSEKCNATNLLPRKLLKEITEA